MKSNLLKKRLIKKKKKVIKMNLKQKIINKKAIVILLVGLMAMSGIFPILSTNIDDFLIFLRPSTYNDIVITSPEEITYSGGMDGYYPAIYGFESHEIPTEWYVDDSQMGSYVTIESSKTTHNDVLKLSDTDGTVKAGVEFDSPKVGGSIDFWLCTENSYDESCIRIYDGTRGEILIKLVAGSMYYFDGTDDVFIQNYSPDKWYHFNILFSCSSSLIDWTLKINQKDYLYKESIIGEYGEEWVFKSFPFSKSPVAMDGIEFYSVSNTYQSSLFIDALGFDWNPGNIDEWPNYDMFVNYNEGLFINYYVSSGIELTNIAYSLDGGPFVEVSPEVESFTIPFSIGGGQHTLQFIGEDINCFFHESEIIQFSVPEILDWGVDAIDAERVWGGTEDAVDVINAPSGNGVKVLVIDTGIDIDHGDLIPNLDPENYGHNFIVEEDPPDDSFGHGTHCAGIIGAADNDYGILGVAPNVELYAAKIGIDGISSALVDDAVQWAIDNEIDIISMSIGHAPDPDLSVIYQEAYELHGITLVAAAGNEYLPVDISYPAKYPWIISVGAVRQREGGGYERQELSSYGPNLIDVMAPGANIYSSFKNQDFLYKTGTSMACPMVAGACALLLSEKTTLKNSDIRLALNQSAKSDSQTLPYYNPDEYGNGLLNAEALLNYDFEPEIELISPSDGNSFTKGSDITLEALVFDHEVLAIHNPQALDKVEFRVDSNSWQLATYNSITELWEWTWDSSAYSLGAHGIKTRVIDSYGHVVETDSINVTLVNPSLSIRYPNDFDCYLGTYISGSLNDLQWIDDTSMVFRQKPYYYWFWLYNGKVKARYYFDQSGYIENYRLNLYTKSTTGSLSITLFYTDYTYDVYSGWGEKQIYLDAGKKILYIDFYHQTSNAIRYLAVDFLRLYCYDYN